MDVPNTRRIVLLGKAGVGKSSLANTIFGEAKFKINQSSDLETRCSPAETKFVNGRSITLIDTPGFFGTDRPEEKSEIVRCITECAPGPHAFLIVLKVEKFTEQEKAVITQMCEYFSEDALKYAVIVFTHGDQLPEEMEIEKYVKESEGLSDLVKKCGGRCHVVDNKYWKNNQQDEYRSNQFQVEEILNTIDKIATENKEGYYTDEKLQEIERKIQKEEERIRRSSAHMSQKEIRKQAVSSVSKKQEDNKARTWIRVTVIAGLLAVSAVLINSKLFKVSLFEEVAASALALANAVEEQVGTALNVSLPDSTLVEIVEELSTPVKPIQTFEVVLDELHALYERTYNPWNPFE